MAKIYFLIILSFTTELYAKYFKPDYKYVNPQKGVEGVDFVIVPNLIDRRVSDSATKKILAESGFTVQITSWRKDPKLPYGTVIGQSPEAGKAINKPTKISVFISSGP